MSYTVRFTKPEDELPAWVADYDPDKHAAAITLRDVQAIAERVAVEHTIVQAWATNVDGRPALMFCGRGARCRHTVEIRERDSYLAILKRVDRAVSEHIDICAGRADGRPRQMTFSIV